MQLMGLNCQSVLCRWRLGRPVDTLEAVSASVDHLSSACPGRSSAGHSGPGSPDEQLCPHCRVRGRLSGLLGCPAQQTGTSATARADALASQAASRRVVMCMQQQVRFSSWHGRLCLLFARLMLMAAESCSYVYPAVSTCFRTMMCSSKVCNDMIDKEYTPSHASCHLLTYPYLPCLQADGTARNHVGWQLTAQLVAAVLLIGMLAVGIVGLSIKSQVGQECSWCDGFACPRIKYWDCQPASTISTGTSPSADTSSPISEASPETSSSLNNETTTTIYG